MKYLTHDDYGNKYLVDKLPLLARLFGKKDPFGYGNVHHRKRVYFPAASCGQHPRAMPCNREISRD